MKTPLANDSAQLNAVFGVDMAAALAITHGSHELLFRLLQIFVAKHGNDLVQFRALLARNEREPAGRVIHSLKGAAGTLCIAKTYELASRLNVLLRENASNEAIAGLVDQLEAELANVCRSIMTLPTAA